MHVRVRLGTVTRTINCTQSQTYKQIIDEFCKQENINALDYRAISGHKTLDSFHTCRVTNIELVPAKRTISRVACAVEIDGKRFRVEAMSDWTLFRVLGSVGKELLVKESGGFYLQPKCKILNRIFCGFDEMQFTLESIGVLNGSVRLVYEFEKTLIKIDEVKSKVQSIEEKLTEEKERDSNEACESQVSNELVKEDNFFSSTTNKIAVSENNDSLAIDSLIIKHKIEFFLPSKTEEVEFSDDFFEIGEKELQMQLNSLQSTKKPDPQIRQVTQTQIKLLLRNKNELFMTFDSSEKLVTLITLLDQITTCKYKLVGIQRFDLNETFFWNKLQPRSVVHLEWDPPSMENCFVSDVLSLLCEYTKMEKGESIVERERRGSEEKEYVGNRKPSEKASKLDLKAKMAKWLNLKKK